MAYRERYCPPCTDALRFTDPSARAVWHDVNDWPHDVERPNTGAFAVHDDHSFQRAYGPGAEIGLGKSFDTRREHRDFLKANHIAERDGVAVGGPKRERGTRKPGLRRAHRSVTDRVPTD